MITNMSEQELESYIRKTFPKEDAKCEWKEFKNLKNSFCGDEKDDVISYVSAISNMDGGYLIIGVTDKTLKMTDIDTYNYTTQSATLRLKDKCTNLSSENLYIEEYITSDTKKKLWIIHIPRHQPRQPVYAHGKAWQRIEDSLVEMTQERLKAILLESTISEDWSAEIIPEATIEDLDVSAIEKARKEYKKRNPQKAEEMDDWDNNKFLNKAKITIKGKITRTALILLGKEEAEHYLSPAVCKIRWCLKNERNENKDYEIFSIPMILAVDLFALKIRNMKYRYVREGTIFPEEMMRYDAFTIREPLHNCIAHQDYSSAARIEVVEYEDEKLIFQNHGTFIPGSVEKVVLEDCPESVYRNRFLDEAMRNVNMIETEGGGIKKLFEKQRSRLFPMPEYDLSEGKVRVEIRGHVIDENFGNILMNNSELSLYDILLLDKVQKHKDLTFDEIRLLRKNKLIEGRKPNFFISASTIKKIHDRDLRSEYIRNKSFNNKHFEEMIVEYIKKFDSASRDEIENLIIDKLSDILTNEQKRSRIGNLLTSLRKRNIIKLGKGKRWHLSEN